MGCHFLLQEIFPIQGWNPAVLHCRQTFYHLSHQGSLKSKNKCDLIKLKSFSTAKENNNKTKKEKIENISKVLEPHFKDKKELDEFVKENMDRKKRNLIVRRNRLSKKINLHKWHYFCTFTYDDSKLNESEFRVKLSNCLKKLSYRLGWRYIGVWERSPINNRLHFHGLFYTPIMIGEFKEIKDYSTKKHEMQVANQNTYFLKRFGRNDFKPIISNQHIDESKTYLMKYLEKSGERIVYSRGLYTYFVSDILEDDIVCTIGQEDRKILLFDNFNCLIDGEVIGQVSQEVIDKMPKTN